MKLKNNRLNKCKRLKFSIYRTKTINDINIRFNEEVDLRMKESNELNEKYTKLF